MAQKINSVITIHLKTLLDNLELLRRRIGDSTGVMAVVKADAYGHGAVAVARTLTPVVGAFAVNDVNEGIELRENGIDKPVLVFGVPEKNYAELYRKHNLTASITDAAQFQVLLPGTTYQLNFDTGMGRLGIQPQHAEKTARLAAEQRHLQCTGIYSHFATSDVAASLKVREQYARFNEIRTHFPADLPAHICNTGGAWFYDLDPYDYVRLGIGMYGYSPGEEEIEGLRPALTWSAQLVEVKEKKEGDTISYGATWTMPADGYVGVIPVGYDDGLRRNLSGNMQVKIGSELYDQAGRITMNYSVIYLGEAYHPPGTNVELLNKKELTAGRWASKLNTIPYEILTGITPKIPRTYRE